jgi:hypothetical protein
MPTNPLESILYRELSKAEAKEVIEIASPLLQELVNYATNALARCATSKSLSGKADEDVATLALYRNIIELTDGIEVLLSQSCTIAAIPLLRSSFEALLALEYILENETDYGQRSLAWVVGYVHKRIDMYERLDPLTNKGQEAKRLFDDDKSMASMRTPIASSADVQKAKANLQTMLAKPHLQPIETEYNKYKKPEWYKLFGGPNDLRTLAQRLRRGGQYEVLYRSWSTTAHAQDFLPFMDRADKGEPAIKRLRDPNQLREIASFAATFLLDATRLILNKLRSGEDLAPWYKRDVQQGYRAITGTDKW